MKYQVILGLVLCSVAVAQSSNWTVGQTVQTSSGPVQGHAASVNNEVSEYLGIPYAVPPVGDLRWTVPKVYNSTTTNNGSAFGFSCPASFTSFGSGNISNIANVNLTAAAGEILQQLAETGNQYSEDCLTINVWTKPQVGDTSKAVLVWIYGGAFTSGSSNSSGYNGQFLVEQEDIILVSFNYRLSIFGFPGSNSPNITQNLGLLDQRLAIEWVRDNIAAFGGDVDRITLFGQSAGGASVDYYTYAWATDPIAAGYIPESGTATGLPVVSALAASAAFNTVSQGLGCANGDLTCMRNVSFEQLLTELIKEPTAQFGPTIDDVVVFSDYNARSKAGNFSQKPMLIGNTDNEAGLFKTLFALSGQFFPDAYWTAFNEMVFICPAAARANVSISNGVPTWRYRYFGAFPNTELTTVPYSGAWHGSELPMLFDIVPSGDNVPNNTQAEIDIGTYMRGAWAAFAKNPTSGLSGYQGGWPMYQPSGNTLIQLAFNNMTGTNLVTGTMYDGACLESFAAATATATATSTSSGSRSGGTATGSGVDSGGPITAPAKTSTSASKRNTGSAVLVLMIVGAVCFMCI